MTDTQRIREYPGHGRLGRHIQHDPRSRAYAYATTGLKLTSVRHLRNVPIWNQGDLGSCTGNAAAGSIATSPLFEQMATKPLLNEDYAVTVYDLATTLDDDPDQHPPTDTGSTGLAAAKALQQLGDITGYQHTFTFADAALALTQGPCMFGFNWYDSFDTPDRNGNIKLHALSQVRGGHEIYADEIDTAGKRIGFTNSWSSSWGLSGRFYASYAIVERLLGEQGDVTVPIISPVGPSGSTGPTGPSGPTGPATPTPEDVQLWADMQRWAKAKALT